MARARERPEGALLEGSQRPQEAAMTRPGGKVLSAILGVLLSVAACTGDDDGPPLDTRGLCPTDWRVYPFAPAAGDIRFPADEGAHYLTDISVSMEWWYTIYHLTTAEGRTFSVMATFFMPQLGTAYRPFNVSDPQAGVMYDSGEWGDLTAVEGELDLTWRSTTAGQPESYLRHRKDAHGKLIPFAYDEEFHYADPEDPTRSHSLKLTVDALKPPLIVGGDGYLTIGDCGDSYYYSLTHLQASGELTIGEETFAVTGFGWLDHQWGPFMLNPLPLSKNSYEWMALHLDNGEEYMVSVLFDKQNRTHKEPGFGSVGWMNADCTQGYTLEYTLERLAYWQQPASGDFYSHRWRLRVPERQLDLAIEPVIDNQTVMFGGTYFYEGRSTIEGTVGGAPVSGLAFAELVHHYAPPVITVLTPTPDACLWGAESLSWQVENPDDGLPLTFDVSLVQGLVTTPLCTGVTEPVCAVDLSAYSGAATIRIVGKSVDGVVSGAGEVVITIEPQC
jgi:predicted secreted hydrolase